MPPRPPPLPLSPPPLTARPTSPYPPPTSPVTGYNEVFSVALLRDLSPLEAVAEGSETIMVGVTNMIG